MLTALPIQFRLLGIGLSASSVQKLLVPMAAHCSPGYPQKGLRPATKNLKPKRVAAACVIPSTSSKEKLLRKSASMPKPARFLRTKAPIRTEFQAGTVGKLRGRNDLNAMSRRSSCDLVSPSSFLRSSSAFRLAGLKIGSHFFPFRSRTPFASGGSVLLVIVGCRLFISLHPCPKHSRLRRRGASRTEKKTSGLALTRAVNKHAQEILSIARPVRVSLIFIQRALCASTRKTNRLQPPRYSWLNNHPIGKQYDEEHSLHRSSKRIRETEKPMWNWTFEKFLNFDYSGLHVIENSHRCLQPNKRLRSMPFASFAETDFLTYYDVSRGYAQAIKENAPKFLRIAPFTAAVAREYSCRAKSC